MSTEYRALVAKVAAFTQATEARRQRDIHCSVGCSSCCHAWLTVSSVEADEMRAALAALPATERERVRERGVRELAREAASLRSHAEPSASTTGDAVGQREPPRCALLDEDGACAAYEARPLVCRTQGHALRYPEGVIPIEAVSRKTANGDVTWCPLNYDASEPNSEDVLDADRVDQILAVVAERHVLAHHLVRHERHALSALAAERTAAERTDEPADRKDVLHDDTARADESQPTN